jgi:hypothetical protein
MHIVALIANILALAIAIIWASKTLAYDAILAVVTLAGALPLALKNSVDKFTAEAIRNYESPCDFVLLGRACPGKTVYLATALNMLLHDSRDMTLVLKDQKSIEKIFSWYRSLASSKWLGRTSNTEDNTMIGTLRRKRRFGGTVESETRFVDMPGDQFQDLSHPSSTDSEWIHTTSVFRAALRSRFVLLFVDPNCRNIYDYAAAVQVLAASLPLSRSGKISKAICIVFSKADLLNSEQSRQQMVERARPLLATCEHLAAAHTYFFVSCTGPLTEGQPPDPLAHENVLAPIKWCLEQGKV